MILTRLAIVGLCLLSSAVYATPESSLVPGGVAIIDLGTAKEMPIVHYNQHRVMVQQLDDHWQAIVGINLSTKPGVQEIAVDDGTRRQKIAFTVADKKYETQHIQLKTNKHVNLSKPNLDRHYKEKKRSQKALSTWRDNNPELNMEWPLKGPITGSYGKRRVYNGQPRKPHSGIDIAATEGTPITAPLDGIVVETGNYFFNGNVVFIDHGQGLITMYCHMSKILVKPDQRVAKGEPIALVGATGRVTGPHLHWGVSLNGNMVDPQLFVGEMPATPNRH